MDVKSHVERDEEQQSEKLDANTTPIDASGPEEDQPVSDDLPDLPLAADAELDDFVWLEDSEAVELQSSTSGIANTAESCGLTSLPTDLVLMLCAHLSGRDVARLLQVNHSMYTRHKGRAQLWRAMLHRDYPFVMAGEAYRKQRVAGNQKAWLENTNTYTLKVGPPSFLKCGADYSAEHTGAA
jgi:hypothetical protein